jgi:hypothetical protein
MATYGDDDKKKKKKKLGRRIGDKVDDIRQNMKRRKSQRKLKDVMKESKDNSPSMSNTSKKYIKAAKESEKMKKLETRSKKNKWVKSKLPAQSEGGDGMNVGTRMTLKPTVGAKMAKRKIGRIEEKKKKQLERKLK